MSDKLVSIIMPVFNSSKFLTRAINSVLDQTYRNIELLISDDASTDSSFELIRSLPDTRIKVFRNSINQGYLKTCNALFKEVKGSYVTFQDSDDWSHPERIAKQVTEFEKYPDLGICGTFAQYYNESGTIKTIQKTPFVSDSDIKKGIEERNQFCGASIMVRRDVLEKVGPYRGYFNRIGNEDYDWSARIVQHCKASNIPEFLYFVRQTGDSITRVIRHQRQLISTDLVKTFIKQRIEGKDYLESNNIAGLKELEERLLMPYKIDQSLVHRKSADISWYNNNIRSYAQSCLLALRSSPLKIINWKYFITSCYRTFSVRNRT